MGLSEDLEHHAQSLQLLMHVRFMGVVADVEHRLMVEAGHAWLAAASLVLAGKPIPKRWLKVIDAWRADVAQRYPQFPEYPEYPLDDIVLLSLAQPAPTTE